MVSGVQRPYEHSGNCPICWQIHVCLNGRQFHYIFLHVYIPKKRHTSDAWQLALPGFIFCVPSENWRPCFNACVRLCQACAPFHSGDLAALAVRVHLGQGSGVRNQEELPPLGQLWRWSHSSLSSVRRKRCSWSQGSKTCYRESSPASP